MGLPQDALALVVIVGGEVFLILSHYHHPIVALIIDAIGYIAAWCMSAYDPHVFSSMFLWLRTWLRSSINADRWGGASVSPTPTRKPSKAEDVLIHV